MTDLSKLKVSLTKHGAHKIFNLLRNLNTADVLDNTSGKQTGINIDRAQASQNLSAFANGNLPGVWDRAKQQSDSTLRQSVFLSIVFSHHEIIRAFRVGSSGGGLGVLKKGVVLDGKAFTNLKNDIVELKLSTQAQTDSVAFDLTPLRNNGALADLAAEIFMLKLQAAGWDSTGSLVDECVRNDFHGALSQSEIEFRSWLSKVPRLSPAPAPAINGDASQPDTQTEAIKPFKFTAGHNPAKEGKSERISSTRSVEADLKHNELQSKLYTHLSGVFGAENVGTELPSGAGGNFIDVVTTKDGETVFYEIKTDPSIRVCIRQALPQLLEYAYWPSETRCKKLLIVAEAEVTDDASSYLQKLRDEFGIPVNYGCINGKTGELGTLI